MPIFFQQTFAVLAAWLRLKYPHVALGALASSAPILYFDNTTQQDGYYSVIDKDYKVDKKKQLFILYFQVKNMIKTLDYDAFIKFFWGGAGG